jgi:hypothetical protein
MDSLIGGIVPPHRRGAETQRRKSEDERSRMAKKLLSIRLDLRASAFIRG